MSALPLRRNRDFVTRADWPVARLASVALLDLN